MSWEKAGMGFVTRIAADIGGTFTDIAVLLADGAILTRKLPSTPTNYADAVMRGIRELTDQIGSPLSMIEEVLHGSTVATNLILEHKGARTALLTTRGFRDVLELRRVRVPALYDPLFVKPPPLVPRHLRFEVDERMDAAGCVLRTLREADVATAIERIKRYGVEAVAVCFLHSYANPAHERAVGELLRAALPDCYISLSSEVLPQKREYERTSTTVINSYVGPPVSRYIAALAGQMLEAGIPGRLMMMQSSGGILDGESVMRTPAQIVECGPAAGVVGAQHVARLISEPNAITLDMGGTTAKASIIEGGELAYAEEYEVAGGISIRSRLAGGGGYALKLPVIDLSEVGAGGGSIAWLDRGGSLKIGPQSAGAMPGPACYGMGNEQATVTDANVVLGYLNQQALAGGTVPIDAALARRAVQAVAEQLGRDLDEAAYGIHTVANANMMKAVKAVTTYRGRDPRDFSLIAFGGNGGIHCVDLARVLQVRRVIVPPAAGVLSALGLLISRQEVNLMRSFLHLAHHLSTDDAAAGYNDMRTRILSILGRDPKRIAFSYQVDARFAGQAFELTVPFQPPPYDEAAVRTLCVRFAAEHTARYGHSFAGRFPVEVVNLRLTGSIRPHLPPGLRRPLDDTPPRGVRAAYFGPEIGHREAAVVARAHLGSTPILGPLIVEEYEGTAVVPPDCEAHRDSNDNIIIRLPS
jgi:N-methylhydantoinase A